MVNPEQGKMIAHLILLTSLSLCDFASAGEPRGMSGLIEKLSSERDVYSLGSLVAGWLEVPDDVATKAIQELGDMAADGLDHTVDLVLQRSKKRDIQKPWVLVFQTNVNIDQEGRDYYFKSDLEGNLLRAVFASGQLDSKGNEVTGTGKLEHLEITSADTKTRFQHELDFWLKGAYRKKKSTSATKPSEATKTRQEISAP